MGVGNNVEMIERPGDVDIVERINSGQCELSHFWPNPNSEMDAVTAIHRSAMRQWIWHDYQLRMTHQSTRREGRYAGYVELPEEVISSIIRIDGRTWNYKTDISHESELRRVFIEKDQGIELDIEATLRWLNASEGSPRYEGTKKKLEEEVSSDNLNNQVILQGMYERIKKGLPILPNLSYKTLNKTA